LVDKVVKAANKHSGVFIIPHVLATAIMSVLPAFD